MNAIATAVTLQAAPAQGPDFSFFIMLAALGGIWFFLVLRPQQKRQKEHEASLKAAEKGDKVVTAGGLHGRVAAVGEGTFTLEVATIKGGGSVRVEVDQARIERVEKGADAKPAKGGAGS
jgi:preprotein translocase subunit YajC